jgi:cytochrome oxidase assembly protein ShyY1
MKRAAALWALPALLACAAFASLGAWQLERGAWKERLLAGWATALAEAPRDYAAALDGHEALPRREDLAAPTGEAALPLPVALRGSWDPASTVLLDNQRLDAAVGVFVLTRFVPRDGGVPLLVNRGWLPLPPDRTPPAIPSPADGEVALRGLLVAAPAAGLKLAAPAWAPGEAPPLLASLDLSALRTATGPLFEGILQLDPAAPDGFTRRWQPLPNTLPPEKHRGYAVQWFGLAAAVAVIYLLLAFRRP